MRFISTQTSFKAGRLSPKLYARIDSSQYREGLSELQGMRALPEGGVDRIKGTRYLRQAYTTLGVDRRMWSIVVAGVHRAVWIVREDDNSLILFTQAYPYNASTDGVQLSPEGDIEYDLRLFDATVVDNAIIFTHYDGNFMPFVFKFDKDDGSVDGLYIMGTGDNFGDLNPNVTEYNIANPGSPVEYEAEGLIGLPMSDIGGVGVAVTISNHSGTSATATFDVTCPGNAEVIAILQRSIELYIEGLGEKDFGDGNDRNIIVSANCAVQELITNGVRVRSPYMYVSGTQDPFELAGVTVTTQWAYSMWWAGNWPRVCTTYEGRLVLGGTPENPLHLFGAKVGSRRMFNQLRYPYPGTDLLAVPNPTGEVLETDPYVFRVSTKNDSNITFLQAAQALVIGTDVAEYVASGGDTIISALSINCKPVTGKGSVPCRTTNAGGTVFFLSDDGRKLNRFRYNQQNGSFVASEVSLLFSDKLEDDAIKYIEWAQHISAVLILMESGKLYGLADDEALGLTGFFDTMRENISSICAIRVHLEEDEYATTKGAHVLFFGESDLFDDGECLGVIFQEVYELGKSRREVVVDQVEENAFLWADRADFLRWDGANWVSSTGTIVVGTSAALPIKRKFFDPSLSGTEDFDGDIYVIRIIVAGDIGSCTVWKITQDELADLALANTDADRLFPISDIAVGDAFIIGITPPAALFATMPIEAGAQYGTAQLGVKNIDTLAARYYKSYSFEFSHDGVAWQEVVVADNEGVLTSGRTEKKFSGSQGYDKIVWIRNTKLEPLTITSLTTKGVSNDG